MSDVASIIFVVFSVIGAYVINSFSIGLLIFPDKLTISEKLLIGISIFAAMCIITGFILSFFMLFNILVASIVFWGMTAFLIILVLRQYGVRQLIEIWNTVKSKREAQVVIFAMAVCFILCMIFESQTNLPQGWDRGNHFADFLYVLSNGELYDQYPGTDYNNFYFQGVNVLFSLLLLALVFHLVWMHPKPQWTCINLVSSSN
ncbi:MAG: hypothetical protein P1Q69_10895 [Candidatus Thorarchaeota archaeon]|nr:hypothetical protein [Candidatus Thorarchaeota archaeon]